MTCSRAKRQPADWIARFILSAAISFSVPKFCFHLYHLCSCFAMKAVGDAPAKEFGASRVATRLSKGPCVHG